VEAGTPHRTTWGSSRVRNKEQWEQKLERNFIMGYTGKDE
jgi:hypothetical protein